MRCLIVVTLLCTAVLICQVNPDSCRLVGKIVDQENAPLAGARVTLIQDSTGISYIAKAGRSGDFQFEFLPSDTYSITAEMEGHQTFFRSIELTLGRELAVTVVLTELHYTDEVTVSSQIPTIPTTSTDSVTHIPGSVIASLPLNGRDYSDLVTLVPQTSADANQRIHMAGGRGIFTSFALDGVDANSSFFGEERGGIRPPFTLSQEAVREFQVSTSPFSAQYGKSSGGIVNAVTKGGSSRFRGDIFLYYRNESFVEKDADGREADSFRQAQYGVTLGGPLSDRWFYFGSTDIQDYTHPTYREWEDPEGTLDDPEHRDYISQWIDLASETGTVEQTNDERAILLRVDGQVSPAHSLMIRSQGSFQEGANLSDDYRTTGRSNNGSEEDRFWSHVTRLTSLFGPTIANELSIHFADETRPRGANITGIPEVIISPGWDAVFGQKNYLPNQVDETTWELRDTATIFLDRHLIRAGIQADHSRFMDWFFRYQAGSYRYDSWNDFFHGQPSQFTQSFSDSDGRVHFSTDYIALYINDTIRFDRLTLSGGLRWERQIFSRSGSFNPALPESRRMPESSDISPRISFAWDPRGDGRSVIRGGWGRFVGTTPSILPATSLLFDGKTVLRYHLDEGDPAMPSFPDTLSGPGDLPASTPDVYYFDEGFEPPRVDRALIEYERDLGGGWNIGAIAQYSRFEHLERKRDENLAILGDNAYDSHNRPDPDFGRKIAFVSDGRGTYRAVTVQARFRSENFFLHAHYTRSRSRDTDSNERSTSSHSFYPEDQYDLDSSRGPSDFDVPNRAVIYGRWAFHKGWVLSGRALYQSGLPYTALSHKDDNGDGYYSDRATWESHHFGRNTFRQPAYSTVDLRLSRELAIRGATLTLMLDVFNLFRSSNRTTDRFVYTMEDETGQIIRNPSFGELTRAGEPRQYQVGVRISY